MQMQCLHLTNIQIKNVFYLSQHSRLCRLRVFDGGHREGLPWQIQRAEDARLRVDAFPRRPAAKAQVTRML